MEQAAMPQTRGQLEQEVTVFINGFEREHMGRGASEIRAFLTVLQRRTVFTSYCDGQVIQKEGVYWPR
jgi:uncharacterized protein YbcI